MSVDWLKQRAESRGRISLSYPRCNKIRKLAEWIIASRVSESSREVTNQPTNQPTDRPTDADLRGSRIAHRHIHGHSCSKSKVRKRNGPFGFYNLQQVGRFNR